MQVSAFECISIPPRYGTNEELGATIETALTVFQFLQGTVQTSIQGCTCRITKAFQFLQGTVQTGSDVAAVLGVSRISIPPRYGTNLLHKKYRCSHLLFQFLQGTVQTHTRQVLKWVNQYFNSSKVRYKPVLLIASVVFFVISIPPRYGTNLLFQVCYRLLIGISIPPRYGTNTYYGKEVQVVLLFQFLQGTVQTVNHRWVTRSTVPRFQFLQGTVQTIQTAWRGRER